jgi:hypothetical protein
VTELIVDVPIRPGESLTNKVAEIIALPAIRERNEGGVPHVLRGMHTERHGKLPGYFQIRFEYEAVEVED